VYRLQPPQPQPPPTTITRLPTTTPRPITSLAPHTTTLAPVTLAPTTAPTPTTRLPITTTAPPTTTTPSPPPLTPLLTVANVTVNATYALVCASIDYYVDGYCEGLSAANPADNFTCEAKGLNGVPCPNGTCPCNASFPFLRRLLANGETAKLDVQAIHHSANLQPPAPEAIVWLLEVRFTSTCPVTGCQEPHPPAAET
jgi:hypothetical protein